jgi:DEAD/DEAH box helicase domain-containing protein
MRAARGINAGIRPLLGMVLDSQELLRRLGYEFHVLVEPPSEPEQAEVTFSEVLGVSSAVGRLATLLGERLYMHQLQAIGVLEAGRNLVLVSGTGSGKTEAWFAYALRNRRKTLVLYPTLALAHDQLSRLSDYSNSLGMKVTRIDSEERARLAREGFKISQVKALLSSSDIVVTNPAFLLMDLKRYAVKPSSSLLSSTLPLLDLLVVDELDFYSPRGISLLLAMIRVLAELKRGLQVAVLTAALANPEEVCEYLREVTGRECGIITGKPFRRENRVILVLGKNLSELWRECRSYKKLLESGGAGRDVLEALESYEAFKARAQKVVDALRALGVELPSPHVDPIEILSAYVDDDYATLVFTRSINRAEELYRKLRFSLPEGKSSKVAAHHHLVSRARRSEIEHGLRDGTIRLVLSPRTLSQGVDIGSVARVVHAGLPEEVREFKQREGRKGRRRDIPFTETVVIPSTLWDRELLSRGVQVFEKWVSAPLEVTLVNKENNYGKLFYALFKLLSRQKLAREEYELLEKLGLVRDGQLTRRGKAAWRDLNFHELAPPFGIKRVFVGEDGEERYLEDVSFSDLVDKFQVGCIDYSSDGVVVSLLLGGSSGRVVRKIVEQPLRESILARHDALAYAIEEYRRAKSLWGERSSLFADYARGKLRSEAVSNVIPPSEGFGMYYKFPYKVLWYIESERGRLVETSLGTLVLRDRRVIEVPALTAGKYSDFTYGKAFEVDYREDLRKLRLGLAFLNVFLRKRRRLPLWTFSYSITSVGGRKVFILWEEKCAGYLEKLDWQRVYAELDEYNPSELAEIYLLERDEEAHVEWLALGGDWGVAKQLAKRVVEYILLRDRLRLALRGREWYVPAPGRHLRRVAVDVVRVPLSDDEEFAIGYVALFDGESVVVGRYRKSLFKVEGEEKVQQVLTELLNSGYRVYVYDLERVREELHKLGLTFQAALVSGLVQMGLVVDVKPLMEGLLGASGLSLESILAEMSPDALARVGLAGLESVQEVAHELQRLRSRSPGRPPKLQGRAFEALDEKARMLAEQSSRGIYLLGLLAESAQAVEQGAASAAGHVHK